MPSDLPEKVNPWLLCRAGETLAGTVHAERMERLAAAVTSVADPVVVELQFERNQQGRSRVIGQCSVTVTMQCQRCLEPVAVPLVAVVCLQLVKDEADAEKLPDDVDPLFADADSELLLLTDLIEDELLMSLPSVARHQDLVCHVPAGAESAQLVAEADEDDQNPFKVLMNLKRPRT
ncbi:MAG TPA: nucleic acid-binding protein [Gammaproteobacteria bacterium]|nr:nucleic acid-binding protein [Gammaproteobacteria bacterium]